MALRIVIAEDSPVTATAADREIAPQGDVRALVAAVLNTIGELQREAQAEADRKALIAAAQAGNTAEVRRLNRRIENESTRSLGPGRKAKAPRA